jgi:ribokinase
MMIDRVVRVRALPRAGETVAAISSATFAGGKGANQAAAAAKCGARVRMLGRGGADSRFIVEALREAGVGTSSISLDDPNAGAATVMVAGNGENAIVIAPEANTRLTIQDIERFLGRARQGDIVLFQNECSCLHEGIAAAAVRGLRVWLNAAPADAQLASLRYEKLTGLIVNETEAEAMTGERDPARALEALAARMPAATVVVTLGAKGAAVASEGRSYAHRGFVVDAVDTVGAGDAFVGAFLESISAGDGVARALERGNAAGALAAMVPGAMPSLPDRAEVDQAVSLGEGARLPARRGAGSECIACGQSLAAAELGARCPECGAKVVVNPFPDGWRSISTRRRLSIGAWIVVTGCVSWAMLGAFLLALGGGGPMIRSLEILVIGLLIIGCVGTLLGWPLVAWHWPARRVRIALGVMAAAKFLIVSATLLITTVPQLRFVQRYIEFEYIVSTALFAEWICVLLLLQPPRVARLGLAPRIAVAVAASGLPISALLLLRSPSSYSFDAERVLFLCMFLSFSAGAVAAASMPLLIARVERRVLQD